MFRTGRVTRPITKFTLCSARMVTQESPSVVELATAQRGPATTDITTATSHDAMADTHPIKGIAGRYNPRPTPATINISAIGIPSGATSTEAAARTGAKPIIATPIRLTSRIGSWFVSDNTPRLIIA